MTTGYWDPILHNIELCVHVTEPYAIMPPLEQFMGIDFEERRDLFYRDVERGDAVIGRINAIRDFGFFITLLSLAGGLERDIEDLELTVGCWVSGETLLGVTGGQGSSPYGVILLFIFLFCTPGPVPHTRCAF